MTFEVVIIVILAIMLWLLLRHWPETNQSVLKQQVNTRKPLEEHETAKRKPKSITLWSKFTHWLVQLYNSVLDWNDSRRRKNQAKPAKTTVDHPKVDSTPAEPDDSSMTIAKAEVAQRKGDYERAEKLLVKAASIDPKNPKIYSKLGIVYLEQGENFEEAEQSFRQALKFDAHNGFVHNNLGLVLYYQDKYSAAAEEFELAIDQDDSIASRHINLGLAYSSLRQFAKAESCYKRALKLDPVNDEYQELAKEAAVRRKRHSAGL